MSHAFRPACHWVSKDEETTSCTLSWQKGGGYLYAKSQQDTLIIDYPGISLSGLGSVPWIRIIKFLLYSITVIRYRCPLVIPLLCSIHSGKSVGYRCSLLTRSVSRRRSSVWISGWWVISDIRRAGRCPSGQCWWDEVCICTLIYTEKHSIGYITHHLIYYCLYSLP